ncbi:aldehyde dehydrogenase [Roseovarius indicus]|uniref:Aldehyde dehydrogenase AldA n=1 Tax=Roseovarius indicus TaxID=540747 RepID=A0A0T5P2C2_9RHOB|nr:aldehyde dehydrogenase [Roseovarius indicus]KRS15271.1 carnitine dehydratase [Roseovarius indicus]OAO07674.1 carnitine dehydratase [Roseovarius indicus]QEW25079.1 Putative aldehyde dehydrogenase AldA [Roseovarius indicus]SFE38661.1 aldehyde dehydrogenase (NAD+) [Roseovarius indicus]
MEDYELFIGGEFVKTADQEYFPAINPYTSKAWANIPQASDAQVADAIAAARQTFEGAWSKVSGAERARLMHRLADLLQENGDRMGLLESTDNGKVIRETRSQMNFAARQYRFFAGYADKLWGKVIPLDQPQIFDYATREPIGVAVLITAWNSPMGLLSNKLAPALAAGNCVVIKPSEHASATTLEFARFVEQAGFPPGVVNVVTGDARVGKALLTSGRIDRVSFTGSPGVGREIAANAGRALVPSTMELGGKSPNIIFEDADVDKAIIGALAGIFAATGQTCIAGSRLLVQRGVYDRVSEELVRRAQQIKMGDPTDKATEMGTAANEPQFNRILGSIKGAVDEGAELAVGGKRAEGADLENGFFVEPTIFTGVSNDMTIAQEEVFGPVLSILPFDTEEEAIAIGNDTKYGLASGIWTTDLNRAMRVSKSIMAGTVWVNTYRSVAVQAPFGGFKDSGFGRERGEYALDEFTNTKNVMIDFSDEERDPFAIKA